MTATQTTEAAGARSLYTDPKILALSFASFTMTISIYAVSPALPGIVSATGVSDGQVGLVITVYSLPGLLLLPVFGILADLYGRRVVVLPSLLLFGVVGVAITLATSFPMILALRLLQGIGGAAVMPVIVTMIGDLYEGPLGSSAQGLRLSANGLSSILIPIAAGFLAGLGWNYPFLLFLLTLPAVLAVYAFVPDTVEPARSGRLVEELRAYLDEMYVELDDLDLQVLLAGGFVQPFSYFALVTFVPIFAVNALGTSVFVAGSLLSIRGVARLALSPASGAFVDWLTRKQLLLGSLFLLGLGTGTIGLAPTVPWLVAAMALFAVGDAVFMPVHTDAVTNRASDDRRAGVISSLNILRKLGLVASPVVFGAVLSLAGFEVLFGLAGLLYLGYLVGMALLMTRTV